MVRSPIHSDGWRSRWQGSAVIPAVVELLADRPSGEEGGPYKTRDHTDARRYVGAESGVDQ